MIIDGIMFVLTVVFLVVKVWAFADCATRPPAAFRAAGKQNFWLWLVLTGVAALLAIALPSPLNLFGLAGIIIALVYLLDVRPNVAEAARSVR